MAASMGPGRAILQAIKYHNLLCSTRLYSIKAPRWMGGGHFIVEKEDDPASDPTFEEIIASRNAQDPDLAKPVNIGAEFQTPKIQRKDWLSVRKKNRSNAELERQARHQKLEIPLEEVKQDYHKELGPVHMKRIAEHYGIYQDLFNGAFFLPSKQLHITYDMDEEFVMPVFSGNRLSAGEASLEPSVEFDADADSLWTLVMSNPDGHLQDNDKEYLHWMIGNIPGNAVSEGEVLCDYLQPFPPKGTGFHRHIFILFKQSKRLDFSSQKRPPICRSLEARTFKMLDFYREYEEELTPVGLQFFQCDWDSSVRQVYHNVLNMKEPEFEFFHPPPYHPPQKMYPKRQPFDRYFDRYRDKKDLAEEVLKMKLDMISPFKEYTPEKYPLIHRAQYYKPSWLKRREDLMHRRIEQFKDLP